MGTTGSLSFPGLEELQAEASELPAVKQVWPSSLCRREMSLIQSRLFQLPAFRPQCLAWIYSLL